MSRWDSTGEKMYLPYYVILWADLSDKGLPVTMDGLAGSSSVGFMPIYANIEDMRRDYPDIRGDEWTTFNKSQAKEQEATNGSGM